MAGGSGEDNERNDTRGANKVADTAVRRALVEARLEFLGFLQHRLGNRNEAEEVLQRFLLRALERASDLRDINSVRSWLGRVIVSVLADYQRQKTRLRRSEISMDPSHTENLAAASDATVDTAVCDCLYKLLPTLKPEYAEIVWRADLLGEPRDRIAASLGTTFNNVNVRLHRGRQALKKRLDAMCLPCSVHGFLDCRCAEVESTKKKA